ncbi:DUF7691 family protein [Planctellipticum variicoloris]|uniref:DUF7691 family protein n=1 Tax=Planctellipticum variicoloris TaxID=3064265 RepID=UPI003013EECD|nr:hypothetical protein SH412_000381 [Planctomycetaceae bacterium SH412]
MSYCHMFYGVDLDRLKAVFGSRDKRFLANVLQAQSQALRDNDDFFENIGAPGELPSSEVALGAIVAGAISHGKAAAPVYGYVLKILCEHLGEMIDGDVAAVRDHPYRSQLIASGPPLPIPCTGEDFPEIGHLSLADIPAEIQRIDAAPRRATRNFSLTLLSWLTKGVLGRQMSNEEASEDMDAYREVLKEALEQGVSIVSFRH